MDKLEQYLEQVCRSIGGPRALRQHVRQELREHLRDAAAQHQAAGLSEEEALDRALADFGGPDEVRTELEATHGHRMLPVVIDKAMQWKELTMRAKWLWTTWAYIAVVGIIVLEVLTIAFASIYLVPKLRKLREDGWTGDAESEPAIQWLYSFLEDICWWLDKLPGILLGVAVLWGLFEWRVRSENKTLMRFGALGTIGAGLTVVVLLLLAALVLPFMVGLPGNTVARPWALEAAASVDKSVYALEQAATKRDWAAMHDHAGNISRGLNRLDAGPALYRALASPDERPAGRERRQLPKSVLESFARVEQAIRNMDAVELDAALKKFRESFEPLREAAKRTGK